VTLESAKDTLSLVSTFVAWEIKRYRCYSAKIRLILATTPTENVSVRAQQNVFVVVVKLFRFVRL